MPRPAVFLDRDGTIAEEVGYLNHASRFRMFPFAAAGIHRLNGAELPVIVVTNQSGVGRGYFPESLVHEVNELMMQELASSGAKIDAIYYCPHVSAENCNCRKPKTGMLEQAAQEHALDLRRSFVVGDRYSDVELARNAAARSILVRTGYGEGELAWHAAKWPAQPDFVADDLAQAADWILRQQQ
ncbi:MAG TPA: HAD family hydrolase [Candidatus Acidoferrum sp.]|nr:HAD family hydrolase [Candidatus Acidoferrum sp.]